MGTPATGQLAIVKSHPMVTTAKPNPFMSRAIVSQTETGL